MHKWLINALLLSIPACSLMPDYTKPTLPVAAEYPSYSNADATASGKKLSEQTWQQVFKDKRLQQLITLALNNNRDLRITALNIEATRAQYGIQQAALFPTINASTDATRAKILSPIGGGVLPPYTSYSLGIGFTSYEIDFFGRLRSLKEQVLQQFLATQEAHNTAKISLVAEVAGAYITQRAIEERLAIALQTQQSQEASYAIAIKLYELGNSNALDLKIAETQLETAHANIAELNLLRAQSDNALVQLLGTPIPRDLPPPEPLDQQWGANGLLAGLPSELLTTRPDIRQAENQLKASNANIGAARAAFFPSIRLTTSMGLASTELSSLFQSNHTIWNFAPQLSVPVFDAGANKANLKISELQKDINIASYEKTIQNAFREVSDALATTTLLDAQMAAQQRLVDAEKERLKLTELRYNHGLDSRLNLLDAQRSYYNAQQTLVILKQSKLTGQITLYKALGGGLD